MPFDKLRTNGFNDPKMLGFALLTASLRGVAFRFDKLRTGMAGRARPTDATRSRADI